MEDGEDVTLIERAASSVDRAFKNIETCRHDDTGINVVGDLGRAIGADKVAVERLSYVPTSDGAVDIPLRRRGKRYMQR